MLFAFDLGKERTVNVIEVILTALLSASVLFIILYSIFDYFYYTTEPEPQKVSFSSKEDIEIQKIFTENPVEEDMND